MCQGPFPWGVACIAVSNRTPELLVQLWAWGWLLLRVPRLGRRYRRYLCAAVRRQDAYFGTYAPTFVRLGTDWPDRARVFGPPTR